MAPSERAAWRVRFWLLVALYVVNPLTYAWGLTASAMFPDSVAYLQLARAMVEHGSVFLAGHGHADGGLILPPLYPALIGAGTMAYDDAILVSQWISSIALLLAVIPLFLLVERASNVWIAAGAIAGIQWHRLYEYYGTSCLTEALFILGLSCLAWCAARVLARPQPGLSAYLLLGIGAAMLFLVRQLGIFFLPTMIGLMAVLRWYRAPQDGGRMLVAQSMLLIVGFAIVAGPYTAILQAQTGQWPWTQTYRLGQYVVAQAADPLAEATPGAGSPDYFDIYAERRQSRKLIEDGTEMEGSVVRSPSAGARPLRAASPGAWVANLWANLKHVMALLGPLCSLTAALGAFLVFLKPAPDTLAWRLVFPAIVAGYLVLLSGLTGAVSRYVVVATPFVVALGMLGVHAVARRFVTAKRWSTVQWIAIAAGTVSAFLLSHPFSTGVNTLRPKAGERPNPLAECRQLVDPGSGVYSFHPLEAYLLGGAFRVVPNDNLDRIARYGRLTGTRWMLFRDAPSTTREAELYDHAPWLKDPKQLFANANYVPRCSSQLMNAVLFEITADAQQ